MLFSKTQVMGKTIAHSVADDGRMMRKNKKYYVLKTMVGGMGVMVAVSRWCCEPATEDNKKTL